MSISSHLSYSFHFTCDEDDIVLRRKKINDIRQMSIRAGFKALHEMSQCIPPFRQVFILHK